LNINISKRTARTKNHFNFIIPKFFNLCENVQYIKK